MFSLNESCESVSMNWFVFIFEFVFFLGQGEAEMYMLIDRKTLGKKKNFTKMYIPS